MIEQLISDSSEWGIAMNKMLQDAGGRRIPLMGAFEITALCNFSCHMCYVRQPNNAVSPEISSEMWIRMAEQAAKAGTLFLLITGGEPLFRKDFRHIYETINKMGFHLMLFTNASLVDERFMEWFSVVPPSRIAVSLYGASPESYKKVCGNADAFEKTIKGLDLLIQSGMNVELRSAITQGNVNELDEIDAIGRDRNLPVSHVFNLMKSERVTHSTAEKVRLSALEIKKLTLPDNLGVIDGPPQHNINFENKKAMYCMAGKSTFWISWDGKMLPCGLMNEPFELPFENSFAQSWKNLEKPVSCITAPEICKSCSYRQYCSVCPARLQAETGSFELLSPYICEMAKMITDSITKYYQNEEKNLC